MFFVEGLSGCLHLLKRRIGNDLFGCRADDNLTNLANRANDGVSQEDGNTPHAANLIRARSARRKAVWQMVTEKEIAVAWAWSAVIVEIVLAAITGLIITQDRSENTPRIISPGHRGLQITLLPVLRWPQLTRGQCGWAAARSQAKPPTLARCPTANIRHHSGPRARRRRR